MATYVDSFDDSVTETESTHPHSLDSNSTHADYETQQLDSFESESNDFEKQQPIYSAGENLTVEEDREEFDGSDGRFFPAPSEMGVEEGFALREWRRENAGRLEEKEKREKEILSQIIQEADEYKVEFYRKREVICKNKKVTNRERETVFLANEEKFYAEADKDYWKAIAELIPREVAVIEKKGKKDQDKKPRIAVIQGPKPGKPTDLSRMGQILIKLKHETPLHLRYSPPTVVSPADNDKASNAEPAATTTEPVAVA